jgi:hypothetical protein
VDGTITITGVAGTIAATGAGTVAVTGGGTVTTIITGIIGERRGERRGAIEKTRQT